MSPRPARILCLALFAAACAAAPLWADEAKPARKRNGPVGTVVDAATVAANVDKVVHDIPWAASLDQAEAQAARDGKLVFLVHALGELDGLT